MTIARFRTWIERRRLVWPAAILFASTLAVSACLAAPAMAAMPAMAGPTANGLMSEHGMPGACCLKAGAAAHVIAIPVSEAKPHPPTPPAGHAVIATAAFTLSAVHATRSLRPPIRAPAVSHCPIYLLNCALLN